jgi:hypothetical protein
VVLTSRALDRMLTRGRQAAESRMRATCKIERPGAQTSDNDGNPISQAYTEVYNGKCRLHYPGIPFPKEAEIAGADRPTRPQHLSIPFGPVIHADDRVTISADLDTPQNVGMVLRVTEPSNPSQATAQRLLCKVILTPSGEL